MKKAIIALLMLMSAPAAFADTLRCTGRYVIYNIEALTKLKGNTLAGPITVNVNGPFGMKHSLKMAASSANIVVGGHIDIEAMGPEGSGALKVDASGPSDYKGTFQADTPMGSGSIPVQCTLTKSAWRNFFGL